jgi:uncharacterized protein (TIGR02217 family)
MFINFKEIQFPSDIAYGATGGPEFFTDVVTSSSGYEQRNLNWMQARCRYNLAPAIKNKKQLDILLAFFRLCHGKAIGFRFKDWADHSFNHQQIAVSDGKKNEFQLIKKYNYLNQNTIRKITKPVKDSIKIYCDEKLVYPEINYNTGVFKFIEAPSDGCIIYASGEFDVPVRFDIDRLITSIESYEVYSHHEIPLVELKI